MRSDRIIILCTVILAAAYLITAWRIPHVMVGDPVGPKVFPVLLGIGLLVGAVMIFFESRGAVARDVPKGDAAAADALSGDAPVVEGEPDEGIAWGILAGFLVWTVLYAMLFERLGYVLATAPYLLGLMALFHRGKWLVNVLVAVVFSVGTYILFTNLLGVQLPRGLLPY